MAVSPKALVASLKSSQMTIIALIILGLLYAFAVFAGTLETHDPGEIIRSETGAVLASHPPMGIHFGDGGFYYYRAVRTRDTVTYAMTYTRGEREPIRFFHNGRVISGAYFMPLGSDRLGRDLWARIVHGSRVSLSVGILGVSISMLIGASLGGIAGLVGGRTDNIIMRVSEMIMMVPGLYLLLTLAAILPKNMNSAERYLLIVVVLSTISWASLARVIRGMVLSLREADFVQAAFAQGAGRTRILFRYILPNTTSYLIVAATLQIPGYILGESALSLLGLGIQEPSASWGNLLIDAKSGSAILLAPWLLLPGLFIVVTIVCFNIIGDALRDALDPGSNRFRL